MHVPKPFKMSDFSQQLDFIDKNSFGVLTSCTTNSPDIEGENLLQATHLPFLLDKYQGSKGTLYTHIAKANSHVKMLDKQDALIIFNGPHGYISPTWYLSQPAVPTWNYAAVHVYGKVELLSAASTLDVINRTIAKYEQGLNDDKATIPDAYKQKLLGAIVGLKITISSIEGQQKLSQNRSRDEQLALVSTLENSSNLEDVALAKHMKEALCL